MDKDVFLNKLNSVYESINEGKILTISQLNILDEWANQSGGTLLPAEFVKGIIKSHKKLIKERKLKWLF